MTSTVIDRIYTPDEFMRLPDAVAYELVDGHLVERNASEACSRIGARIVHFLMVETEKTHEACVYGPDLTYACVADPAKNLCRANVSVIRKARLEGMDDVWPMRIPADLVVEVPTRTDKASCVNGKVELYLSSGFGLVWLVYPEQRIIYVHRADGSVSKLREWDEITGEAALPGFRRTVGEIFKR